MIKILNFISTAIYFPRIKTKQKLFSVVETTVTGRDDDFIPTVYNRAKTECENPHRSGDDDKSPPRAVCAYDLLPSRVDNKQSKTFSRENLCYTGRRTGSERPFFSTSPNMPAT